ncbi:MAG: glycosyltransferase [Planctomycetaceae bacterium]|nr:glycosyltransferase [Planctomycetaceae bacterium]
MSESSLEQSNNPCRVTFLITDLDQGGAEQALAELITRLDRTRWSPSVLCLSAEGCLMERLRATHIPVEALGARSPSEFPRLFFRLRRHLKKLQPDLLCTYLYHANIAGRLAAATIRPRPRIFSGIRVAEKRFRSRLWLDCLTNWLVNGHICVSQDVATFSHEVGKLPASKLHVLPNGIDVTRFDEAIPFDWTQLGIPADSQILLYVGRKKKKKGL